MILITVVLCHLVSSMASNNWRDAAGLTLLVRRTSHGLAAAVPIVSLGALAVVQFAHEIIIRQFIISRGVDALLHGR
jgi:hypothetical protein